MYDWSQTLAADRSVYALWPLAAGCHHIYIYMRCALEELSVNSHLDVHVSSECPGTAKITERDLQMVPGSPEGAPQQLLRMPQKIEQQQSSGCPRYCQYCIDGIWPVIICTQVQSIREHVSGEQSRESNSMPD